MPEEIKVLNNNENQTLHTAQPVATRPVRVYHAPINKELKDEFVESKKKRGLIGKLYAFISPIIPFTRSDKSVEKALKNNAKGMVSDEDVSKLIERNERANSMGTEVVIDTAAATTAMGVGLMGKKIGGLLGIYTEKAKGKIKLITAYASVVAGFATKGLLKLVDLIGKKKDKDAPNQTGRSLGTAIVDGVGGFAASVTPFALPAVFGVNLLAQHAGETKKHNASTNMQDFKERIGDNFGILLISALTMGIIGAKGHINLKKISELKGRVGINKEHVYSYKPPKNQLTEFQQLARDLGYDLTVLVKDGKVDPRGVAKLDEDFLKILLEEGQTGNVEGKIKKLEEENIFLPKYLQTMIDIPDSLQSKICTDIDKLVETYGKEGKTSSWNGRKFDFSNYAITEAFEKMEEKHLDLNGLKDLQGIIQRIKSDCPTSRDIDAAQKMIDTTFPAQGYKINRLLGVGSIAESYLAVDKEGKEVVIKIVKEHFLDADKIARDKAKALNKVDERSGSNYLKQTIYTTERKKYDIEQLNNMYKVWGDEINLSSEAISAQEIASQAQAFKPVKVIEYSDNIFVMERAKGVQMDSKKFVDEWKKAGLTEEDFTAFVENYIRVYCEQLFSLPKSGMKVVQSDPHGGNILVDVTKIKGLKDGEIPITIIDYGNTTKSTRQQAIKNLFNHIDYLTGNTDAIADAMLEGAQLGNNNKRDISRRLSQALQDEIYNPDTKIDVDNPVKIFSTVNSFCLDFLQKNNVIPNASHINQMKAEETYIISNLGCLKNVADSCGYDLKKSIKKEKIIEELLNEIAKAMKDSAKYEPVVTTKEISKRYKYLTGSAEEALTALSVNFGI